MRHATIRDVARQAGVSVASVSRVLNGHANVRASLRTRVEEAASALGYVPHVGARSLSLKQSNALGVMLPDLFGEFYSEALRGMDREASARGMQLLLSNMHGDAQRAAEGLRSMRGRVDGMILMAPDIAPDHLSAGLPPALPTVLINCSDPNAIRPEFRVDNHSAALAAVRHLIAAGARRVVHIAGPAKNREAIERRAGYEAALAEAGLPPHVLTGDFSEEAGVSAAETLLRDGLACDAIFAANDMMAIGALTTLRRASVAIPDRVAIIGFDDIPLARLVTPALTTMRVGIADVGARAVARLCALISGEPDEGVERVIPHLVARATTPPVTSASTHRTATTSSGELL